MKFKFSVKLLVLSVKLFISQCTYFATLNIIMNLGYRTDDVSDEGLRLGAAEVAVERGNDLFLVREDTLAESHQLGLWRRVAIGGDRW